MEAVWCGGVGGSCRLSGVWWSNEIPSVCYGFFFFFLMFDNYTFSGLIKQDSSTFLYFNYFVCQIFPGGKTTLSKVTLYFTLLKCPCFIVIIHF